MFKERQKAFRVKLNNYQGELRMSLSVNMCINRHRIVGDEHIFSGFQDNRRFDVSIPTAILTELCSGNKQLADAMAKIRNAVGPIANYQIYLAFSGHLLPIDYRSSYTGIYATSCVSVGARPEAQRHLSFHL